MSRHLPIILLLICFGLLAGGQVWLSHKRIELAQHTRQLENRHTELQQALQNLHLELASLARPERLRRIAQEELHMGPPRPMQVLRP